MTALTALPKEHPLAYPEVRNSIEDGDIILFCGDRELSKLIARISNAAYSHAGLVLTWYGRRILLSAEMPKVQALPLGLAVAGYRGRVDWYKLVPEARARLDLERLALEALVNLGIEYGTDKIFSLAAHYTLGMHVDEKDEEETPQSMICSQYVSRCFRKAGVDLSSLSDVETVPGELAASPLLGYMGTLKPADKDITKARLQKAL